MTDLHTLYQQRYAGEMKFRTSPKGLHSAITAALGPSLLDRRVLDIGCGAGRLSLLCAARGAVVTGVDFSEEAVALARTVHEALVEPPRSVEFRVGRFEDVADSYDVVVMSEVFEHIEQPPAVTLRQLRRMVRPGGTIVVSSPSFVNFRGMVWMTLQKMFDFCMSPSDVHFVFPWEMEAWCAAEGLAIERHVGLFFDWGWGAWAADDMTQRIGYALRDKRRDDPRWASIDVQLEPMREYIRAQGRFFESVMQQYLPPPAGPIEAAGDLALQVRQDVASTPFGAEVADYLADARVRSVAEPPLNMLGATQLYLCVPR